MGTQNWMSINAQEYAKLRIPVKNLIYMIVEQNQAIRFEVNGQEVKLDEVSINVKYRNGDYIYINNMGNISLAIFYKYSENDSLVVHCRYDLKHQTFSMKAKSPRKDYINSRLATQEEIDMLNELCQKNNKYWDSLNNELLTI